MRPIVIIRNKKIDLARQWAETVASRMEFSVEEGDLTTIEELVESHDVALVVIGLDENPKRKEVQHCLDLTRTLRVPYVFVKSGNARFGNIGVPVKRFEEEKEKAPYCGSFARNFGSHVTIYQPDDYGSSARRNIDAIKVLLEKQGIKPEIKSCRHDSDGVEFESLSFGDDMVIIGASRDYGLDDILFGPKERKIIIKAAMPVMMVNPRGDLYPLCD